jgi:hypothetical protein
MYQRRYEFHRDDVQVLALVFDEHSRNWLVEVSGRQLLRSTILLDAFEKSEDGQRHSASLRLAVEAAVRRA